MNITIPKGQLSSVLAKIEKSAPTSISMAVEMPTIKRLPFGLFEMDTLTNGGMPYNRLTTIWGIEGSGKGNLLFNAIRMSQLLKPDKYQVWIDAENVFDPTWAVLFGIDLERLIIHRPVTGEDGCDAIEAFVEAEEVDIVVVDSLPSLIPVREMEREMATAEVGGNALMIRRLTNKLVAAMGREEANGHEVLVVYINQVRLKIGQMHGNPETMPCGIAPRFWSSLIIKLYAKDNFDKSVHETKAAFRETNATITKSKVLVNGRTAKYFMAMIAQDNIEVGRCDSWNAVNKYLKSYNLIEKTKQGYDLYLEGKSKPPVEYRILTDLKESYLADDEFANLIHKLISDAMNDNGESEVIEDKNLPKRVSLNIPKG